MQRQLCAATLDRNRRAAATSRRRVLDYAAAMNRDELHQKLDQIEEQARLTLAEFPKSLTRERQRMIIALVRCIRAEASGRPDLEATVPLSAEVTPLRSA